MLATAQAVLGLLRASAETLADAATGRLTRERLDRRLDAWSRRVLAQAQVDLHVHGRDDVDWSRAYVVLFNHQSHFDVPVLYQSVRGTMRMVAKKELFYVPLWGRAMRKAGMIRIDRQDRAAAIASLRAAGEQIRRGIHVGIAPEGTRSPDGRLGPLKKGGFVLARETGTPILPVAVVGTRAILAPGSPILHRGRRVDVHVGKPIPVEGREVSALIDDVRAFLAGYLRPPTG